MENSCVVITHWVHPEVIEFLEQRGYKVIANQTENTLSQAEVLSRAQQAQALMAFMPDCIDESFLQACPQLKIVAGAFRGYDNCDVEACTQRGIWVTVVPELLAESTAELTVGLLIVLGRRLPEGDALVRNGQFQGWRPRFYSVGLQNKTLGIIGMGELGQALAKRMAGFEMNLLYCDPKSLSQQEEKKLGLSFADFEQLLQESDYVALTVPLQANTLHLMNRETIARMKPGSFLINTCRGSVVDEKAVAEAVDSGHLAGYAADVFEMEDWTRSDRPDYLPPSFLENRKKIFLTPHLGSAVSDVRCQIALNAAQSIDQALKGKIPNGAINQLQ